MRFNLGKVVGTGTRRRVKRETVRRHQALGRALRPAISPFGFHCPGARLQSRDDRHVSTRHGISYGKRSRSTTAFEGSNSAPVFRFAFASPMSRSTSSQWFRRAFFLTALLAGLLVVRHLRTTSPAPR